MVTDDPAAGLIAYSCPVLDCRWRHVEPERLDDDELALGRGVIPQLGTTGAALALARRRNQRREDTLGAHLREHTVVEWASTVAYWRARAETAAPVDAR